MSNDRLSKIIGSFGVLICITSSQGENPAELEVLRLVTEKHICYTSLRADDLRQFCRPRSKSTSLCGQSQWKQFWSYDNYLLEQKGKVTNHIMLRPTVLRLGIRTLGLYCHWTLKKKRATSQLKTHRHGLWSQTTSMCYVQVVSLASPSIKAPRKLMIRI